MAFSLLLSIVIIIMTNNMRFHLCTDDFSSCCPSLTVTGTVSDDVVDKMIMGLYTPHDDLPSLEYESIPGPVKKFPVYIHTFDEVREIGEPRRSFLYFYFNEDSRINEEECPEGCWMIGELKAK